MLKVHSLYCIYAETNSNTGNSSLLRQATVPAHIVNLCRSAPDTSLDSG